MLAQAELHLALPAPDGCLADAVFQGVDLAKCLMGTPVWWDHAISLSPQAGGALATPG